jgi:ferredoxin-NADP reductase
MIVFVDMDSLRRQCLQHRAIRARIGIVVTELRRTVTAEALETRTIVREHEAALVIQETALVADDVVAVTLSAPDGAELPAWTPGAHIDVVLDEDLTRQYSLCGPVSDLTRYRIGVLKSPTSRGGSVAVHALKAGDNVRVRGPRNHFPLIGSGRYQFIAGGIGITPLLPMIAEVEAAGTDWNLVYGGRSRSSMAFLDELDRYGQRVTVVPQDEQGAIDLAQVLGQPRTDTAVYCCGPTGLLDAVEGLCQSGEPGTLHYERFAAKEQAAVDPGSTFDVVLARSGMTLTVPADKSIFEVCRDAGVSVLGSCFEGVCGTCETGVLDGEVDHRDSILNEEERESNEFMMICVSRCKSKQLTLDL